MIMDAQLLFDQNVTIAGTQTSTNTIDLLNARDMGIGDPSLKIMINAGTQFVTANSATLTVQFQTSADNATWATAIESPAMTAAQLNSGNRLLRADWPRPAAGQPVPRYVRLNYVVGTGTFTAGAVTAAIVLDREDYVAYASGFNAAN